MNNVVSARRLRKSMLNQNFFGSVNFDIDDLIENHKSVKHKAISNTYTETERKNIKEVIIKKLSKLKTNIIIKIFLSSLIIFAIVSAKIAFYEEISQNKYVRSLINMYQKQYTRIYIIEKFEEISSKIYSKVHYVVPEKVSNILKIQYINNIKPKILNTSFKGIINKMFEKNAVVEIYENNSVENITSNEVEDIIDSKSEGIGGGNPILETNNEINSPTLKEEISAVSTTDIYASQILSKNISIIKPVDGKITSLFGSRQTVFDGVDPYHTGLDIANAYGTIIVSATTGKVINIENNNKYYGKMIEIDSNGVVFKYGHLSNISTVLGADVKQGGVIGQMGSTGMSTGNHLHFEIRVDGVSIDPLEFIQY